MRFLLTVTAFVTMLSAALAVAAARWSPGEAATASDARLKKDVVPIDDGLQRVQQLQGVQFAWRMEEIPFGLAPEGRQLGLIAQDARDVVPEAIREQLDETLRIDYTQIVPLLIEATKTLAGALEETNARLQALEERVEALAGAVAPVETDDAPLPP